MPIVSSNLPVLSHTSFLLLTIAKPLLHKILLPLSLYNLPSRKSTSITHYDRLILDLLPFKLLIILSRWTLPRGRRQFPQVIRLRAFFQNNLPRSSPLKSNLRNRIVIKCDLFILFLTLAINHSNIIISLIHSLNLLKPLHHFRSLVTNTSDLIIKSNIIKLLS